MNVKINGFQRRKTATTGKKQLSGQIHRFGKGETDTLEKRQLIGFCGFETASRIKTQLLDGEKA